MERMQPKEDEDDRSQTMCSREDCNLSKTICTVTIDVVQALALERDSLKQQIQQRDREIEILRAQRDTAPERNARDRRADGVLNERSETTYLHIVGALLMLLLTRGTNGQSHSSYATQESIIGALVERYGKLPGISERTLLAKFAAAKRALNRD
jgi:hypothetical protein